MLAPAQRAQARTAPRRCAEAAALRRRRRRSACRLRPRPLAATRRAGGDGASAESTYRAQRAVNASQSTNARGARRARTHRRRRPYRASAAMATRSSVSSATRRPAARRASRRAHRPRAALRVPCAAAVAASRRRPALARAPRGRADARWASRASWSAAGQRERRAGPGRVASALERGPPGSLVTRRGHSNEAPRRDAAAAPSLGAQARRPHPGRQRMRKPTRGPTRARRTWNWNCCDEPPSHQTFRCALVDAAGDDDGRRAGGGRRSARARVRRDSLRSAISRKRRAAGDVEPSSAQVRSPVRSARSRRVRGPAAVTHVSRPRRSPSACSCG